MPPFEPASITLASRISVATQPINGDGPRSVTVMDRPGGPSDDYGGWREIGSHRAPDTVIGPDGEPIPDMTTTTYTAEVDLLELRWADDAETTLRVVARGEYESTAHTHDPA
jgi:hypothetical protein